MRPRHVFPSVLLLAAACAGPRPGGADPAAYGYAKPAPADVAYPEGQAVAAVPTDPYCREAVANAAGAAQTAAISGSPSDAARAARAERFARRDC